MHMCENNCALTLEDEIKFWGLDDGLLQVAAVFIIHTLCFLCLSDCPLFGVLFRGLYDTLLNAGNGNFCHILCLLCSSV